MAYFKRKALQEQGFTEEQIDYIMGESGRFFNGYVPQDEVQTRIDAALADAEKNRKPQEINIAESPEYKALQAENTRIKALGSDDFKGVKAPYREMIWEKLDHAEKHKPYAEQLTELAKSMPDIFIPTDPPAEQQKPSFSAHAQGSVPGGEKAPSFMAGWGFVPQKN